MDFKHNGKYKNTNSKHKITKIPKTMYSTLTLNYVRKFPSEYILLEEKKVIHFILKMNQRFL